MSDKEQKLTPVQSFYKDKTILITGASGFMGKVLLEKLLYSCSELKEVIILIRPKRGKSPDLRLEDMFKLPVFHRIRDEKPELFKKVVPIQGDVTFESLGLSGELTTRVCKDTNIVFHCAATLRLEANLKDALDMNTTGTKRVLMLARNMKKLEAFIHLSTAFCYCDQEILLEKVYDCPHNPDDLMRMAEWVDLKTLEKITPDLLKPHPNTYTYSKRLAEILVQREYPNLPVAIARPSIVSPAWAEPLEGWVDSLNGPIGVLVGAGKGVIRTMLCEESYRSEIIPVDIAIAGLIAMAFTIGTMTERPKNIPVYNVTCVESKKTQWGDVLAMGKKLSREYPFEAGVWYPGGDITTSTLLHNIRLALFHWLPAYLIDFIMLCIGQKRFMCRIQQRISDGLDVLQFFTTRQWDFRSERFDSLYLDLTPEDKKIFDMEMEPIDAEEYMKRGILGGRQYCLKEPLSTLPKARMQMKLLFALDVLFKFLMVGLLVWAIFSITGLGAYWNGADDSQAFVKSTK